MTCDDCEGDGQNEERPEVPEGVLRGIEDITEGNTASKEDLENLCDIDESDHPDPELYCRTEVRGCRRGAQPRNTARGDF